MTVEGDAIVLNCRECFQSGYGVPLLRDSDGTYACKVKPSEHRYHLKHGFTHRV